jgi:four helix bundle protein
MTNPSSTTRSSMFIKWSCPLSHGRRFSCRRSARLERVCIARFAISFDRASLSSLLNTAEGNGKRQGKQRAKFFDDARGSAVECAACLDALVARKLATIERVIEGKRLLFRTVGMLTKLVERFDSYRAREDEKPRDENENDHEDE